MNELKGIYFIVKKDIKTYYFKPPNISWGLLLPFAFALAFVIRNPLGFKDLTPGLTGMALLFGTTSMAAIVVTFERRVGSLERLLLAPISAEGLLLGKIGGGLIFGLVNSSVVLLISGIIFGVSIQNPIILFLGLILSSFTFSALGTFISVLVKEVFEAMTLNNFYRFPMIFLSGVFIPISSMPPFLQKLSYVFPLTYTVDILKWALKDEGGDIPVFLDFLLLLAFGGLFFIGASLSLKRRWLV